MLLLIIITIVFWNIVSYNEIKANIPENKFSTLVDLFRKKYVDVGKYLQGIYEKFY